MESNSLGICLGASNIKIVELIKKGKDGAKLPDSCYKLNGLYNFWTFENIISDEFKGLLSNEEKDKYKNLIL